MLSFLPDPFVQLPLQKTPPTSILILWNEIYVSEIAEVQSIILDLSLHATPCRYYLVGGTAFLDKKKLIIHESVDLPDVPYILYYIVHVARE